MSTERSRTDATLATHEKLDNLEDAVRALGETVTTLAEKDRNGGAHFTPEERAALRHMLREQEFVRRFRRLMRIVASYTAATALFFYTLGDYIKLIFNALKAGVK